MDKGNKLSDDMTHLPSMDEVVLLDEDLTQPGLSEGVVPE